MKPEAAPCPPLRQTLADFVRLARPFWGDRRNGMAWLLLLSVIGLGLVGVQINVALSYWNKSFYDALAEFDTAAVYPLLGRFAALVAAAVVSAVYLDWLRKLLVLRWREAMTQSLSAEWLGRQAFFRLGLQNEPDNPDQRIADDVRLLVTDSIELLRWFINSVARLLSFAAILWTLSGLLVLPLGGQQLQIPGYLLWFCIAYALFGSVVTHLIGRPLQGLNFHQQRSEADLRATLLRQRDHAEQIALYDGGGTEQARVHRRFASVAANWRALMDRERTLGLFTLGFARVNNLVSLLAATPSFLAKAITLGQLMQVGNAFMNVSSALSWFVHAYSQIAAWAATVQRLTQFREAIHRHQQHQQAPAQPVAEPAAGAPGGALTLQALAIDRPDGSPLLQPLDACVRPGAWLRVAGPSGVGKSTLMRVLAGLWPYCRGLHRPQAGRRLLLPQQPYMPPGPLAELLCYPGGRAAVADVQLQAVLQQVGLGALATRLDEEADWPRVLSGGEQQRLSLARALLFRPDCLMLDEATSQLDDAAALALMQLLRQALPGCTVVAVTHQPALHGLFDDMLVLQPAQARHSLSAH